MIQDCLLDLTFVGIGGPQIISDETFIQAQVGLSRDLGLEAYLEAFARRNGWSAEELADGIRGASAQGVEAFMRAYLSRRRG